MLIITILQRYLKQKHHLFFPLIIIILVTITGCESDPSPVVNPENITVMTYNIHHGADPRNVFNLEQITSVIKKSSADIIALQEVDRGWSERSNFMDEADYLAKALQMNFIFGATLDRNPEDTVTGKYGLMILSRYPIVKSEFRLLPSRLEQRGLLLAWIKTLQGELPVACTHLGLSAEDRQDQLNAILRWLPEDSRLLLLGDFNTKSDQPELSVVHEKFTDLQKVTGLQSQGTFYHQNWWRIDYIFAASGWSVVNCQVIQTQASDHYPVLGRLRAKSISN